MMPIIFQCELCPKTFPTNWKLKLHSISHSKVRPFLCKCGKAYKTKNQLNQHKAYGQQKFECSICPAVYKTKQHQQRHIMTHGSLKPFACAWPECGKGFRTKQERIDHQATHSDVKNFACDKCERKFNRKRNMVRHAKTVHVNEKQCECEFECGFKTKTIAELRRHYMRRHTNEKLHVCDVCGDCFVNHSELKYHRPKHFPPSYRCPVCSKLFKYKKNISSHVRHLHQPILSLMRLDEILMSPD